MNLKDKIQEGKPTYKNIKVSDIESMLKDIFCTKPSNDKELKIMVSGYEDKNGVFHSKALEEFDKAMKEEVNKRYDTLK